MQTLFQRAILHGMLKFFKFDFDDTVATSYVKCYFNDLKELHFLYGFKRTCIFPNRLPKKVIQIATAFLFKTPQMFRRNTIETGFAITYKKKVYASIEEPLLYA